MIPDFRMHNGSDPDDSHRPEVYGESLTVVRTVRSAQAGGGGGYKFLDHRGRNVPAKKPREELDKILTAFRIQVDNPVAILNQDNAKTFLADSNPGKLYDFFMRATLLVSKLPWCS